MQNPDEHLSLPRVLESKIVLEEKLFQMRCDALQNGQQPPYRYYSLLTPPYSAALLAITPEGAYVINKEYRHPTGRILIGCPGGFVDSGEDVIQAAKRELLEETGFHAKTFEIMGSAYPYAGFSAQKTIYIKATEAVQKEEPRREVSEVIQVCLMQPQEIVEAMRSGAEIDGTLCTALYFHHISLSFH